MYSNHELTETYELRNTKLVAPHSQASLVFCERFLARLAAVMVDPTIGETGDVDTAIIILQFANGAIGTIDHSRIAVYGHDQRMEVFDSNGMIQAHPGCHRHGSEKILPRT